MSIQLITFDLDDTLWDTAPVIVSAELALREWLAEQAPQLGGVPTEHLWAIREQILTSEPQLREILDAWFAQSPSSDPTDQSNIHHIDEIA